MGVLSIRMRGEELPIYGPYIRETSIIMIIVCSTNNAYQVTECSSLVIKHMCLY